MISMLIIFTIMLVVPMLFLSINLILSKKPLMNQEKATPFECGFDPLSLNRLPFSIQFFLISMVFLIFDVEIVILIPLIMFIQETLTISSIYLTSIFMIILIMGLYFEYMETSLEWKM